MPRQDCSTNHSATMCRWTSFPVRSLLSPGEWLWVDSNGKDGKSTFRRGPTWSWVFIDLYR